MLQSMDPKLLRAKAMHILKENDDVLRYLVESETEIINKTRIDAENDFELAKKYYGNQGIIDGLRRFVQKLNDWASKDV